jgi:CheY-like chemotaxis protein
MTMTGLRILLVEDEAIVAMMAEDMLDSIGCAAVVTARSIAEAMAALDTHDFDAAMLDVNLNGERSTPIADAALARGLPYIFTTGYEASGIEPDHASAIVLAKPYLLADLERALMACTAQTAGTSSITSITDSNRG